MHRYVQSISGLAPGGVNFQMIRPLGLVHRREMPSRHPLTTTAIDGQIHHAFGDMSLVRMPVLVRHTLRAPQPYTIHCTACHRYHNTTHGHAVLGTWSHMLCGPMYACIYIKCVRTIRVVLHIPACSVTTCRYPRIIRTFG